MICPTCGCEMTQYKEQPSYDSKARKEYRRKFYRCIIDDTWGRYEIPVGPMSDFTIQQAEVSQSTQVTEAQTVK